jgi:hypothetical protein
MAGDAQREVDQLLKEKEKYEAWLKRLDSEKTAAPQRAFERVRADYQQRLSEVMSKLQAHGHGVQTKLRELESKIEDLEAVRAQRAEALDEAQLRRAVGEFREEKDWAEREAHLLGALRHAEEQLNSAQHEIERLRELVSTVHGADVRAAAGRTPAAAGGAARGAAPGHAPARPAAKPGPAAPKPGHAPPRPAAATPARPRPAAPTPTPAEVEEGFLSLEELVFSDEETEPTRPQPHAPAAPKPKAKPAAPPPASQARAPAEAEAGVGDELAFLESLSLGGGDSSDAFSFLEKHGSGTPQTIICPHCSAANDPAEWYCTECGEELPAE